MATKNRLSPSTFRILDLPPEIVGNICEALPDEDLYQTRFVCRELKALASTAFGARFFNHVVAILHPASLGILLEIARHEEISKFVRKVTISGEQVVNLEVSEMVPKMLLNMEKSGLDSLLLVEVFRCLPRLDVVRMDVISVHRVQCIIRPVYCGASVGIFKTDDDQTDPTVYGYNRVYKIVLSALEASGVHKNAELELQFTITASTSPDIEFFDLNSTAWRYHFASNVQHLDWEGRGQSTWWRNLLRSAKNVKEVVIDGDQEVFTLSDLLSSNVKFLSLNYVTTSMKDLLAVINNNAITLDGIWLQSVALEQGSWWDVLKVVHELPDLSMLFLNMLYDDDVSVPTENDFSLYGDSEHFGCIELGLKDAIPAAVSMILNDYRGTDELGTSNSAREFLISVDLRKAKVEIERHIVWDGKGWKLSVEQATEITALVEQSPTSVSRNEDFDENYVDEDSDDAETPQGNNFAENDIRHNFYARGYIERPVYSEDDADQGDFVDFVDYPYAEDFSEGFFSDEE